MCKIHRITDKNGNQKKIKQFKKILVILEEVTKTEQRRKLNKTINKEITA